MEILGALVVLSIISLIAVPTTIGLIGKIRLKALEDSAYGLLQAGNLFYAEHQNTRTVRFDKTEDEDTLQNLKHKGSVETGTVIINKHGQVTVCASDGKNSAYKNYNDTKITLVSNKTCNVPSNTYVVYLDNARTISEYTNEELTEIVEELREEMAEKVSINDIYPVGSIYMSTTDNTVEKVQARFGGTWEVYGDGRMIKSSTSDAGTTGGSNSVTLSNTNLPSHTHSYTPTGSVSSTFSGTAVNTGNQSANHTHSIPQLSGTTTSNGGHTHTINGSVNSYQAGIASSVNFGHLNTHNGYSGIIGDSGGHTHTITTYASTTGSNSANHHHSVTAKGTVSSTFSGTANQSTSGCVNCNAASFSVENKYITVYMYKRTA